MREILCSLSLKSVYNTCIMKKLLFYGKHFIFLLVLFLHASHPVFAQNTQPLDTMNTGTTGDQAYVVDGVVTVRAIEGVVTNFLAIAVSFIGFAGFVMLIIGSFQFLLAGSNSKGVEGGKSTMTFAIVGLVVALTAWMVLNFIATFTGVDTILRFNTFFPG